jgi:hypothetical protein
VLDPPVPSASLAAALAALTLAIDETGANLAESLDELADACRLAVSSYAGLSVHATVNGRELGFTTLDGLDSSAEAATSLRVTLNAAPHATEEVDSFPAIVLILYAHTPGAFVDLSADLTWLLMKQAQDIALDQDLTPQSFARLDVTLVEMSSVDQAIGVLVGRGNTPEQARRALTALSERSGRSLTAESEYLLESLATGRATVEEKPI